MRVSLVDKFIESIGNSGIGAAVNEFKDLQNNHSCEVYFSIQELMLEARKLLADGKYEELQAIMKLGIESFPETMYFLASANENLGKISEAKQLYEKISKCKAFFPWEEYGVAKAKEYLNSN